MGVRPRAAPWFFFTGIVFVAEFSTQFSYQHPGRRPPLALPDNPCVCATLLQREKKKADQLSNTVFLHMLRVFNLKSICLKKIKNIPIFYTVLS